MTDKKNIQFVDNQTIQAGQSRYICIDVHVLRVLESWRDSLFSFEWLMPDGKIKSLSSMGASEKEKRLRVEEKIVTLEPIEKPVLGIGLQDNVEIGSGRAEFLTLAAHGCEEIPVHILKSHEKDFKDYRTTIDS